MGRWKSIFCISSAHSPKSRNSNFSKGDQYCVIDRSMFCNTTPQANTDGAVSSLVLLLNSQSVTRKHGTPRRQIKRIVQEAHCRSIRNMLVKAAATASERIFAINSRCSIGVEGCTMRNDRAQEDAGLQGTYRQLCI